MLTICLGVTLQMCVFSLGLTVYWGADYKLGSDQVSQCVNVIIGNNQTLVHTKR